MTRSSSLYIEVMEAPMLIPTLLNISHHSAHDKITVFQCWCIACQTLELLLMCLYSGYVTRFLFTLCSSEDSYHEDDDNCENYTDQPLERCCHRGGFSASDDPESRRCHLCSSVHEQLTDDSGNKHSEQHVYDDDGDLIVKRKCHQDFEIVYIG